MIMLICGHFVCLLQLFLLSDGNLTSKAYTLCYATLIVIGLMFLVSLPYGILVKEEVIKRYEEEIRKWEEAKRRAIEKRDRKKYLKLLKKEKRIKRLKDEVMKMRQRPQLISFGIWFLVTISLGSLRTMEVAYFPLIGVKINLFTWFMILSFWLYNPTTKILKMLLKNITKLLKRGL